MSGLFTGVGLLSSILISQSYPLAAQVKAVPPPGVNIIPAHPQKDSQSPGWFNYELRPGEAREDQLALINLLDESTQVELIPVDATTTKDGTFAFKSEDELQEDLGTWIEIDQPRIVLSPEKRALINFRLVVPDDAQSGDHLGGIIAKKIATDSASESIQFGTEPGVRIYLTVSGRIEKLLKLIDASVVFNQDQPVFHLNLRNDGNTRIEGFEVLLGLDNNWWFGPTREEITPSAAVVFPGKEIEIEVPWQGGLDPIGDYAAQLSIHYEGNELITQSLTFRSFRPVKLLVDIGFISAIFIVGMCLVKILARLGRSWKKKPLSPTRSVGVQTQPGVGDEMKRKVATTPGMILSDEMKFEIRRIIREELELARLVDQVQEGTNQSGNEHYSYLNKNSTGLGRRLFERTKKRR